MHRDAGVLSSLNQARDITLGFIARYPQATQFRPRRKSFEHRIAPDDQTFMP